MDSKPQQQFEGASSDSPDGLDRRDLILRLGKLGAYVAPFTVLAMTASAASGSGPGKHK
jgi:hypothetical protein